MITYRKIQIQGENSPIKGLWYARPVISETLDIVALAKHMSKHNTPFSPGVIKGVLADMVSCIKELILDGKNVKLDDLAIFSVGIVSDHGAESAQAFKVSEHVKGLKLRGKKDKVRSDKPLSLHKDTLIEPEDSSLRSAPVKKSLSLSCRTVLSVANDRANEN